MKNHQQRILYSIIGAFLNEEIAKKWPQIKKCSFTKTMHHVISRSQRWQNYMNCTLNWFYTNTYLQIWLPATSGCLQTSKECSKERDLAPMKKWYRKLRHILTQRQIVQQKKHWIGREVLESVYRSRKRLCGWIKSNFAKKLFYWLCPGLIEWCLIYTYTIIYTHTHIYIYQWRL